MSLPPRFPIRINDLNHDGRGRGQLSGRTVLVSQALPGETVLVRSDRATKTLIQGRVARIEQASTLRIQHSCSHEFHCTGCPLLALNPTEESRFKQTALRGVLLRVLPEEQVRTCLRPVERPSELFGYRHLAKQIFHVSKSGAVLGSYVHGTHQVVDNSGCPVLAPELATLMRDVVITVRRLDSPIAGPKTPDGLRYAIARQSQSRCEQLLTLVYTGNARNHLANLAEQILQMPRVVGVALLRQQESSNVLLDGDVVQTFGKPVLRETLLGFEHSIGPKSFFQINPSAAQRLFTHALNAAGSGRTCLELYSGVGALTLPLASQFERVQAVESVAASTSQLARTAARAGLTNIEVHTAQAASIVSSLLETNPEVVVVDPPRAGMGNVVAHHLAQSRAQRIVILSCAPRSLTRDLPPLLAQGFRVQWVQPVDQFPRTAHVETVTLLSRNRSKS